MEAAELAGFDPISVSEHVLQSDVGGRPQSPMFDA
jgi:hypothetical protein